MEIYLLVPLSYLLGSLSSAVIVCRLMGLPDPRGAGSNNPGATNVLRLGGRRAAAVTLLGDVLKGLAPVLVARLAGGDAPVIALCAGAGFLGHLFPVFFGFRGGKGVATGFGVFIGLSPPATAVLAAAWLGMALALRYSSLAALTAGALAPLVTWYFLPGTAYFALACFIAVLLFWRHRTNVARLLDGTESRINLKKS